MSVYKIKETIPLAEVAANPDFSDFADLAVIFNHEIVVDEFGTWRWKRNMLVDFMFSGQFPFCEVTRSMGISHFGRTQYGQIDLNGLRSVFCAGKFALEEYVKFYMQIGYSLSGFIDVWCNKTAKECGIEGNGKNKDVIEYLLMKHKGTVLKL